MKNESEKYNDIEKKLYWLIVNNINDPLSRFKWRKFKSLIYQYQLELYRINSKKFYHENVIYLKEMIYYMQNDINRGKRYYETGLFTLESIQEKLKKFNRKLKISERILNMINGE